MSDLRTNVFPPVSPDALAEFLTEQYAEEARTRDDLVAKGELLPPIITTQEVRGEYTDVISKMTTFLRSTENQREGQKRPFLAAERQVDGHFKEKLQKAVLTLRNKLSSELTRFLSAENARLQAEARAREEAARAEAERLAEEAKKQARREARQAEPPPGAPPSAVTAHRAAELEDYAEGQREVAEAKPAERVRGRSEGGALSTLGESWQFEVTDVAKIPRKYCRFDPALFRDAMREAIRTETIEAFVRESARQGIRVFKRAKAMVR